MSFFVKKTPAKQRKRNGHAYCASELAAIGIVAVLMIIGPLSPIQAQTASPQSTVSAPAVPEPPEDWPNLARYQQDNAQLKPPARGEDRVVFMGDSITEGWGQLDHAFPGKSYLNRGISGQTTPQMLLRFRADVIALQPRAVVILGGTNDIAGNTGPMTPQMTEDNLMSMAELAKAHGIHVILASVLPASDFPWKPGLQPADKIATLNAWIKDYAARNHFVYLDYYASLVNDQKGMKSALSPDGVHPNAAGYAIMGPLAQKAITQALH